jgi:hypothetical protein
MIPPTLFRAIFQIVNAWFLFGRDLYLDPGTGSFIIQVVIAGALGAALAVRIYWGKIKSLFKKGPQTTGTSTEDDDVEE